MTEYEDLAEFFSSDDDRPSVPRPAYLNGKPQRFKTLLEKIVEERGTSDQHFPDDEEPGSYSFTNRRKKTTKEELKNREKRRSLRISEELTTEASENEENPEQVAETIAPVIVEEDSSALQQIVEDDTMQLPRDESIIDDSLADAVAEIVRAGIMELCSRYSGHLPSIKEEGSKAINKKETRKRKKHITEIVKPTRGDVRQLLRRVSLRKGENKTPGAPLNPSSHEVQKEKRRKLERTINKQKDEAAATLEGGRDGTAALRTFPSEHNTRSSIKGGGSETINANKKKERKKKNITEIEKLTYDEGVRKLMRKSSLRTAKKKSRGPSLHILTGGVRKKKNRKLVKTKK